MAYEPVLAPTGVTSDSTFTTRGDIGFRHYLERISTLSTPTTQKKITSTAFIIPQNEIVNTESHSISDERADTEESERSPWSRETPEERNSPSDLISPISMAIAKLAIPRRRRANTQSSFQENGLPRSTLLTAAEAPQSARLSYVDVEMDGSSGLRKANTSKSKPLLNWQFRKMPIVGYFLSRNNSRKNSISVNTAEGPSYSSELRQSASLLPQKPITNKDRLSFDETQILCGIVKMRSTEVAPMDALDASFHPIVHWTQSFTRKGDSASSKAVLYTTCLQTSCEQFRRPSSRPQRRCISPMQVYIGKVETSALPTSWQSYERDVGIAGQLTTMSCFGAPKPQTTRQVTWENKSTSPFTIPFTIGDKMVTEVEQSPISNGAPPSHRNGSDPTDLSKQGVLEDESSSLQSDDGLTPDCERSSDVLLRSSQSTPVFIAKCQSAAADADGCSESAVNSPTEGSKHTLTGRQSNFEEAKVLWQEDKSSVHSLSQPKSSGPQTPTESCITAGLGSERRASAGEFVKVPVDGDSRRLSRLVSAPKTLLSMSENATKQRNKIPPTVSLKRNRDVVNGVQSPLSPRPPGLKEREHPRLGEVAISPPAADNGESTFAPLQITPSPLRIKGGVLDSRRNSCEKKAGLRERVSPSKGVLKNDQRSSIGHYEQALSGVSDVKENASKGLVSEKPKSVPSTVENDSSCQEAQRPEKRHSLSSNNAIASTPQKVFLEYLKAHLPVSSNEIGRKSGTLPNAGSKPVAKVSPSTVLSHHHSVGGEKSLDAPAEKSHAYAGSRVSEVVHSHPPALGTNAKTDGDPLPSVKMNGLSKAEEEVGEADWEPIEGTTTTSKELQSSINVTEDLSVGGVHSARSSVVSISQKSDNTLTQKLSPTSPEESKLEALNETSSVSTISIWNEGANTPLVEITGVDIRPSHSRKARPSHPILSQKIVKTVIAPCEFAHPPEHLTVANPPPRSPVTRKPDQMNRTSTPNQHFFAKTHQFSQPRSEREVETAKASPSVCGVKEDDQEVSRNTPASETDSVKGTKITRSRPVQERPKTMGPLLAPVSETPKVSTITPPETHTNIDPREHFLIHEKVGGGKFGNVERCENKRTHEIMAMKKINTHRVPRHSTGDIMEVAVLRAIGQHDNIACLLGVYEMKQTCYIITEFVGGGALYERVIAEDNLDEMKSALIIRQVLLGLEHIQAHSVLHLDLKPENVMMVEPSGYRLKIIDFGLAYFYDPVRPRRQIGGTYTYSAPETINYDNQGFTTDIWSVAVIAYELLSGITPFECPQSPPFDRVLAVGEVTTNIVNCRYNFDDDGICDASDEAKNFIRSILKKEPKDRPSVQECLQHDWVRMPEEQPTIRRAVSLCRRATQLDRPRLNVLITEAAGVTQSTGNGLLCLKTNDTVY